MLICWNIKFEDSKGMNKTTRLSVGKLRPFFVLGLVLVLFTSNGLTVNARNNNGVSDISVGISSIISPVSPLGIDYDATEVIVASNMDKTAKSSVASSASSEESTDSKLVMANVSKALNIRETPDEDSTKVGVLYKDCGGKIL